MATMHVTQHQQFPQRTQPECSIVVNDVDDNDDDRLSHPAARDLSKTELNLDNTTVSETTRAKIEKMQVEAELRKNEFARLLEEHAQVIRRLKQMEESETGGSKA